MALRRGLQILQSSIPEAAKHGRRSLSLMSLRPGDFAKHMKENNLRRCYVVFDKEAGQPVSSSAHIDDLQQFCLNDSNDYLNHEGFFLELGRRTDTLMGAFVWRTHRGQACGGIRLWEYNTMEEYLRDGLRLAYGMGAKSALAGLWAGGGKGVIASPGARANEVEFRKDLFLDYGDFLSGLNGCYVAAEDAGVVVSDLDHVHQRTRYTTCISEEIGGSGNPSIATGKGVVCAMEAALDFLEMGTLEGKTVVSQGCGNVARIIFDALLEKGIGKIIATDCNEKALALTQKTLHSKSKGRLFLEHVAVGELGTLSKECDILSPNALGNILTKDTIPNIKAKVVCGAANNQLGKPEDNLLMSQMGITYIVDFLCNRMGIVNCANETYGRLDSDPAILQHFDKNWEDSIWNVTHRVLSVAKEKGITPVMAAAEVAEAKSLQLHPIWPHRSQKIIEDLVNQKWEEKQ